MLGFSIINNWPSPGSGRKKFIPKYSFVPDGTRFRCRPIFPALKRWATVDGEIAPRRYRIDCSDALRAPNLGESAVIDRRYLESTTRTCGSVLPVSVRCNKDETPRPETFRRRT